MACGLKEAIRRLATLPSADPSQVLVNALAVVGGSTAGGISVRAHRLTDCQSVGICSFPRRAWKSGVPAACQT